MAILTSLIHKETLHIVRDTRTMVITLLMPLVLLLLFGFAISTEVNDIRIVAVADRHTDTTRDIIQRFRTNSYFIFMGMASPAEVEPMLRRGEIDAAIFLRQDGTEMDAQVIVDASNTTVAQASAAYVKGVLEGSPAHPPVLTYTLYNPQLRSAYNFVPGIMGMIFILICAIMTSVSIVSEKEDGTLDLLTVSPVRPGTVIIGKLIPYFVLSCIILAAMLTMAYTLLGLPLSARAVDVVVVSLLYIILSLSVGLLVSTLADTRLTALIVSAVLFMLPVIMLSGMIFPIDNMPRPLQWLSCAIPARWYTEAMRKLMIQQLTLGHVAREVMILIGMTVVLLAVAVRKFNKSH